MNAVDWSVIVAGISALGALLWTSIVVPVRTRQKAVDLEIKRLEAMIRRMETDLRTDLREALAEAVDKIGDRISECVDRHNDALARHVADDQRKHKELFDQTRELIAAVARLEGTIRSVQG